MKLEKIQLRESDVIIITLALLCIVMVFLLYQQTQQLNTMIEMFNEFCYMSPQPRPPLNLSNVFG